MREFREAVEGLDVLEALQVQGQDPGESLQSDLLLCLLFRGCAKKFVFSPCVVVVS